MGVVKMIEPSPKCEMKIYSKLWTQLKNKEFNHEDASKTLNDDKMISIILSDLKKSGWLKVRLDPSDSRKKLYKLISPENALKEIAKG
jgi:hypothetical protein